MRRGIVAFWALGIVLGLLGCEGKGGYKDIALIAQAQRALTRIRNSLEEYYLDRGSYPGEKANLKDALTPYFFRVVFYEGDEIARQLVTLKDAKNRLTQVKDRMTEYQAEMEMALTDSVEIARLKGPLEVIHGMTRVYELELEQPKAGESPRYPGESFERLKAMVDGLLLAERRERLEDSVIVLGDRVTSVLKRDRKTLEEAVEDSLRVGDIWHHIKRVDTLWSVSKAEWLEGKTQRVGYLAVGEVEAIKKLLPKDDTLLAAVDRMVVDYARIQQRREAMATYEGGQWKVERASDVLTIYEKNLRERAKKASVIVKAQEEVKKMAEAIEAYRVRTGAYPRSVPNLPRFFEEEYADTAADTTAKAAADTVAGGSVRVLYTLDYLTGPPLYSTSDPLVNFRLDATVDNRDRTPVFCDVKMVNEWDETVARLSQYPVYTTTDSTITYFLKAKANDSSKTPLSERPAVVREKKEEKTEKGKKAKKGKRR